MSKDYYQETIIKIEELINEGKISEAQTLLNEELSMPYIPSKYEGEFAKLQSKIRHALISDDQSIKMIALDSIVDMLYQDEVSQQIALESLGKHNLRPIIVELKKRIESWEKKDAVKRSFLFEILVAQQIDTDINIDGVVVNPAKTSILSNPEVIKAFEFLDKLEDKNIQIIELATNEIRRYLLKTFPTVIEDGHSLAQNMYMVVKSMFIPETNLSEQQEKLNNFMRD